MNELTTQAQTQNLPTQTAELNTPMAMAVELSKSDIIPKEFQKKPANCLIAVELANRLKASPFQVMQNMDVIYGRPALRSAFVIACINNSGKIIGSLKFETDKEGTKCRAWAVERETGSRLIGPTITLDMAKAEGWLTKNGSKWKTMPDLMLRYRAASFFGRLYCPEILNGMYTEDEANDIQKAQPADIIDPFEVQQITAAAVEEPKEPPIETTPEINHEVKDEVEATSEAMEVTAEMEQMANEYFEANEQ